MCSMHYMLSGIFGLTQLFISLRDSEYRIHCCICMIVKHTHTHSHIYMYVYIKLTEASHHNTINMYINIYMYSIVSINISMSLFESTLLFLQTPVEIGPSNSSPG